MLKNLLSILSNYKFLLTPIVRYNAKNIGDISGINELKRETPIIVSLSSDEKHFDDLELTLCSIFTQSLSADKVILWLNSKYKLSELPYSITRYVKNGLEIRFAEASVNTSFIKTICSFKEFPDSIIVTAEDSIIYRKDWLKRLYHSYITNPQDIHVNKAHYIQKDYNKLLPFENWDKYCNDETASFKNFPLNEGGILYPPNCFKKEIFREDIYAKKLNTCWELWAWGIALLSDRKIRIIKNHYKSFYSTNIFERIRMEIEKNKNSKNIDTQLVKLCEYYGNNIKIKLNL